MNQPANLFADLPHLLPEESSQTLLSTAGSASSGSSPTDTPARNGSGTTKETDEWVLLVSGAARLRFEGEEAVEISAGSYIDIPARKRHRVEWTDPHQPTIWLPIHYSTCHAGQPRWAPS